MNTDGYKILNYTDPGIELVNWMCLCDCCYDEECFCPDDGCYINELDCSYKMGNR